LDLITCNGERLLKIMPIEPDKNGKIALTVCYWIVVLVSIFLLTIIKYKKLVAKIYAIILTFGLLLCGSAMVLWILTPKSDQICHARWWLKGLGMVIFSGGVFCRSYQLKKIHFLVKSGRYQKSRNFDHIKLLITGMGLIISFEVLLLLILQFSSPFKSVIHETVPVIRYGEYHCENNIRYLWISAQSGYLVFILVLGIYSLYSTWKISSSVDDTRINILMIFICVVVLIVTGVVWGYSNQGEDADVWWALAVITIWGVCMMCSVFIPKLVKSKKSSSVESKAVTGTSTT